MSNIAQRLTHSVAGLSTVVVLAACQVDGAVGLVPTPEPQPQPQPQPIPVTTRLQIDFTNIQVVKDCDGIEGDGDFVFRVRAVPSWDGGITVHSGSHTLGEGARTAALGRRSFSTDATEGKQLVVEFTASEVDQPIIGAAYNDSRMNNLVRTAAHSYRNGSWTGQGPRTIVLGSGDCQVQLNYTVNQLP